MPTPSTTPTLPLRLLLAGHAPIGLRRACRHRRADPAQASAGAGRLRPGLVRSRATGHAPDDGTRPDLDGRSQRASGGPGVPAPRAVRLRRYEIMVPDVLVAAPEPARPGRGLRHRPHPGRRRDGPALVRAGPAASYKRNTFTDFIAAAEHLVAEGWTAPRSARHPGRQRRRAADGGGGQPAARPVRGRGRRGALRRQRQHDARRDIPLTVTEYDEWGDPNDPEFYDVMRSYSPYENVAAQDYPALLVTAGLNDPQSVLGAGEVGGEAAGHRYRRPACCSRPRWAPGTAARPAGTTPGGTRRSCTRSCSTCRHWPIDQRTGLNRRRRNGREAHRAG